MHKKLDLSSSLTSISQTLPQRKKPLKNYHIKCTTHLMDQAGRIGQQLMSNIRREELGDEATAANGRATHEKFDVFV
jgi:hypothetical protein